jgi:GrpB-like predicted nucleotidyltransferase (UPF0157 family)
VSLPRRWWGLEAGAGWADVGRHVTLQEEWSASCAAVRSGAAIRAVRRLSCPGNRPVTGHVRGRVIRDGQQMAHDLTCNIAVRGSAYGTALWPEEDTGRVDDTRDVYLDEVLIGGREHVVITIVDYDQQWPRRFEDTAERVRGVLGDKALSVEHIGSTSVPGLAAKPIVDMLLTVADVADEAAYVPTLESIGFVLRVREPGHRMLRTVGRDTHLHVYEPDRAEVCDYLDLRDWLRVDASDRARYAAEKRRLAEHQWRDMNDYAEAKTDIIRDILTRARAWRART